MNLSEMATNLSAQQLKELYDAYIENMRHESELIDHRINRLLGVQAFLLAFLAALALPSNDTGSISVPLRAHGILAIYVLGTFSALITGIGVVAAKFAADFFQNSLDIISAAISNRPEAAQFSLLPEILRYRDRGLRAGTSWLLGRIADTSPPWLILFGWFLVCRLLTDQIGALGSIRRAGTSSIEPLVCDKESLMCDIAMTMPENLRDFYHISYGVWTVMGAFTLYWMVQHCVEGRYDRWWRRLPVRELPEAARGCVRSGAYEIRSILSWKPRERSASEANLPARPYDKPSAHAMPHSQASEIQDGNSTSDNKEGA